MGKISIKDIRDTFSKDKMAWEKRNKFWLYYTGWMVGVTIPFYFYVGFADSKDGEKSFERISRALSWKGIIATPS